MKLSMFYNYIKECQKRSKGCDPEINFNFGKTCLEIKNIDQFTIIPDVTIKFKKEIK